MKLNVITRLLREQAGRIIGCLSWTLIELDVKELLEKRVVTTAVDVFNKPHNCPALMVELLESGRSYHSAAGRAGWEDLRLLELDTA